MGILQNAVAQTTGAIAQAAGISKIVAGQEKIVTRQEAAAKTAETHLSNILETYQRQADAAEFMAAERWQKMDSHTKKSLLSALGDIQKNLSKAKMTTENKTKKLGSFSDYVIKEEPKDGK